MFGMGMGEFVDDMILDDVAATDMMTGNFIGAEMALGEEAMINTVDNQIMMDEMMMGGGMGMGMGIGMGMGAGMAGAAAMEMGAMRRGMAYGSRPTTVVVNSAPACQHPQVVQVPAYQHQQVVQAPTQAYVAPQQQAPAVDIDGINKWMVFFEKEIAAHRPQQVLANFVKIYNYFLSVAQYLGPNKVQYEQRWTSIRLYFEQALQQQKARGGLMPPPSAPQSYEPPM